jgi:EH domain-containing protein 1
MLTYCPNFYNVLNEHSVLFLQIPLKSVTSIVDGLKKSYIEKLRPLEKTYQFHDFVSPLLVIFTPLFYLQFNLFYNKGKSVVKWCVSLVKCCVTPLLVISPPPPPKQTSSDFDAKPMVMLLGQYSTGKTTFIKHLLKTSYPGETITWITHCSCIPSFL